MTSYVVEEQALQVTTHEGTTSPGRENRWDWSSTDQQQILIDLEEASGEIKRPLQPPLDSQGSESQLQLPGQSLGEVSPSSSSASVSIPNEDQASSSEPQRRRKRPSWVIDYEVLERFHMENCNSVGTPTEPGLKLSSDLDGERVDRTTDFGIFYKKNGGSILTGFTDSDYAGDLDDRRSTSGYVLMMGSGAISWASKKQQVVSLSTTEAEFIAAASSACQAIWLRRILEELHFYQHGPTVIHCDNSSTIKLSRNPVLHGRSKHIDVRGGGVTVEEGLNAEGALIVAASLAEKKAKD
ncbi:hypothetical protein MRB53_013318 [Persea americana]|uniref:Uncharacterized protein n=1 Tax=Persea americana TaxID=3435 RepID=A0ACC2K832_PERAE|nr:hypothetical protein MRB53_013318 [Persea americana]